MSLTNEKHRAYLVERLRVIYQLCLKGQWAAAEDDLQALTHEKWRPSVTHRLAAIQALMVARDESVTALLGRLIDDARQAPVTDQGQLS